MWTRPISKLTTISSSIPTMLESGQPTNAEIIFESRGPPFIELLNKLFVFLPLEVVVPEALLDVVELLFCQSQNFPMLALPHPAQYLAIVCLKDQPKSALAREVAWDIAGRPGDDDWDLRLEVGKEIGDLLVFGVSETFQTPSTRCGCSIRLVAS
jgi:hypothetical protein